MSVLLYALLPPLSIWAVAALYFDVAAARLRTPLAAAYVMGATAAAAIKPRPLAAGILLAGFALTLAWWLSLKPSNERDWQPDVAVLPYADISGDRVTLHNIRHCDYRTETDYDVRYEDKTFDLDDLRAMDLFLSHWGSPLIAHTIVSFGFKDGDHVAVSIEARKTKGEDYSAIRGFFRQYELIYIVADERDVIRLRTNFRHENVYLYRLKVTPEAARNVLLDYLRGINSLKAGARWYNALSTNCTTTIRVHTNPYAGRAPWDWRLLVNGYVDEMLYERGRLDRSLPFPELKRRSLIDSRGQAAGRDADFSGKIRSGLPGFGAGVAPGERR
jgi:hypothetical protein